MDIFCKIFCYFEETFWDTKNEYFYISHEKRGYYPIWKNITKNILMCCVVSDDALRIENMDSEKVKDEI